MGSLRNHDGNQRIRNVVSHSAGRPRVESSVTDTGQWRKIYDQTLCTGLLNQFTEQHENDTDDFRYNILLTITIHSMHSGLVTKQRLGNIPSTCLQEVNENKDVN